MKQNLKKRNPLLGLKLGLFLLFSGFISFNIQAQDKITGIVKDVDGITLPGVSVIQKGTTRGTSTDFDGKYSISLTAGQKILVFSYLGYKTVEVPVNGKTTINVSMKIESESLEEIVIVGYGTQKKESVVGAITQIKGADLQTAAGGITNVEEALQGNLPGVTAIQGSGIPGQSDVQIFIRGQASWNGGGQPLILVDGVPRTITDIDFNDIENVSVLKDASATAVFGVQGANGVILITTKRGKKGKAQLSLNFNTAIKTISKLPQKLDSYDAILEANSAILRELPYVPGSWDAYRPLGVAERYLVPNDPLYPNIDWREETLKDFAQDYRVNLSVRGGGDNAKYFGSLAYQTVDDIFDGSRYDNGKGYSSEFKYDRFNYRTNIDFNISKTTEVSVNLGGYLGTREAPANLNVVTNGIYEIAPNAYTPVYDDGTFGRDELDLFGLTNPIVSLTNTGYNRFTTFEINTDVILKQNLDFLTKGLRFESRVSVDSRSTSLQSLNDPGGDGQENVVYRIFDSNGVEFFESPQGVNDFAFVPFPWTVGAAQIRDGNEGSRNQRRYRNFLYDFSLNYVNTFADVHNVTGLFLVRRREFATGNQQFDIHREDWVARATYDYDSRYFLDVSGAYNGSEKFGPGFRFDFFPAVGAGWTVSNEAFMEDVEWINKLKFRGSYGLIGDDQGGSRFAYQANFSQGGTTYLNPNEYSSRDSYVFLNETRVGNPNLQWETAVKYNIAAEVSLFNNLVSLEFDYFGENRDNILIPENQRAVPEWFGTAPPPFNLGATEVRGYELVVKANYTFANDLNVFGNFFFTEAKDVVINREDPALRPDYQKAAGFTIGQPRSGIPGEIITNWDDVYSSTPRINGQESVRIGYYNLIDYDGSGAYDGNFDNVPFGFPNRPQRSWNATLGMRYKGLSLSAQVTGTQNTNRNFASRTFNNQTDVFFTQDLNYWTKDNPTATNVQPDFNLPQGSVNGRQNFFDASLVRLRNVSLSYKIPKKICKNLGVSSLNFFANGTNLLLWTDLPDDREFNGNITADSSFRGDYPTLRRFNLGFNLNF
ncbi:TonB-dependent receptor [uncultured Polaribacter sp.]|uniref:SusC/RagA family TonB-linked outer membrane protein n=1 Tax=uncultured Polaribacter sp. TaxID=174711 RepID=UPI0026176CA9|nr:TonB-dependent receptor [uncultured Polaribacter sp.]